MFFFFLLWGGGGGGVGGGGGEGVVVNLFFCFVLGLFFFPFWRGGDSRGWGVGCLTSWQHGSVSHGQVKLEVVDGGRERDEISLSYKKPSKRYSQSRSQRKLY